MAHAVTDDTFDAEVLQSPIPVLVDFWGIGCAPCEQLAPVIEELARDFAGRAKVVKMNTSEHFEAASNFGVRMLPTIMVFKNGQPVKQSVGFRKKADLAKLIESALQ